MARCWARSQTLKPTECVQLYAAMTSYTEQEIAELIERVEALGGYL